MLEPVIFHSAFGEHLAVSLEITAFDKGQSSYKIPVLHMVGIPPD